MGGLSYRCVWSRNTAHACCIQNPRGENAVPGRVLGEAARAHRARQPGAEFAQGSSHPPQGKRP